MHTFLCVKGQGVRNNSFSQKILRMYQMDGFNMLTILKGSF